MPELETVMGRIGIPDLVMFSCLFLMIGFVLGLASASYILKTLNGVSSAYTRQPTVNRFHSGLFFCTTLSAGADRL